jgi:ATP-dependent RNA helicase SUPV3L1/SUV3
MAGGGFTVVPDMMSLVGCSGEEFSGVLRALGFQAEERRVTLEPKAPAADTGAGAGGSEPGSPPPADPDIPVPAEPEVFPPADPASPPPDETPPPGVPETPPPADSPGPPAAEPEIPALAEAVIEVWWPKDTGPFRKHSRSKEPRDTKSRDGQSRDGNRQERKPQVQGAARGKSDRQPVAEAQDVPARDGKAGDGKAGDGKAGDGKAGDRKGRDFRSRDGKPREAGRKPKLDRSAPSGSGSAPREAAASDSPFAVLGALKAQLLARKH